MALTSFFTALTGLNANSHSINVIGDNLANMNTIGFKAGKATFAELIGAMSGFSSTNNPIVFGQGAALNGIATKQTQGTPEYTGNSTDAMIAGNGYFVVSLDDEGTAIGYTRAGRFQFDRNGGLVTSDGYKLMGYPSVGGAIDVSALPQPLNIRMGQLVPAVGTTEISAAVNLDARKDAGETFATSIEVYDSLGNQHAVRLEFIKTSAGGALPTWTLNAQLNGTGLTTIPASPIPLVFDSTGVLTSPTGQIALTVPANAYGANLPGTTLTLSLSDDQGPLITSTASESATSSTKSNGYPASTLASISFMTDGIIQGTTSIGSTVELGQLAVATFANVEGMQKYNGSTFIASGSAGLPAIGTAGSGGRGSIMGGSLEMSNVDMAEQFINLIMAQRAFQANARIITASDELYQEAIHLKR